MKAEQNRKGLVTGLVKGQEVKLAVGTNGEAANIFGLRDENLRFIEQHCAAKIVARSNEVTIYGSPEEVARAEKLFQQLVEFNRAGMYINVNTIRYALSLIDEGKSGTPEVMEAAREVLCVNASGHRIRPKTVNQYHYLQAVQKNDIVFGIGPAGTGKTYLAVVMAVRAMRSKQVERMVITRPAVEAGEKLGFLPGDLQEKVNPYLRPVYDSLYDILGVETTQKYMERSIIEVAPLAYMRGRTLDNAFIILDEAQNTTPEQMKMFLTRMGRGSQAVVTGDITQIDLPRDQVSGLVQVISLLRGIKGIEIIFLTEADVVRHPLVQKIIAAYEEPRQLNSEVG